jgi:hypothetical protein
MEDFKAHEKPVLLVSTKEVVQPSLNGLLLDLLQFKLVHLAKTTITKLKPTPQKFLCCAACISVMQYTLFPLGIEPRQPPEWAMAYAQSEMQTSTLNHRHSPLSQPRGAGDQRDHHSHRRLATEAPAGRSRRRRRLDRMTLYTLAVLRRDFFASYVQSGFKLALRCARSIAAHTSSIAAPCSRLGPI